MNEPKKTILRSSSLPPLTPEERAAEEERRRKIDDKHAFLSLNFPRWKRRPRR